MGNISINLNLTQLKHVRKKMQGASGKVDCLIIPIKENDLFVGEKNISLSLSAFGLKSKRDNSKTTHIIKQQYSKELYDLLTDEEKREMPIIGDAVDWSQTELAPVSSATITDSSLNMQEEQDDLPF
ncbi:hypothetical protein [Tenacibaculum finnmarkense]|uniref:hypothetical protein n=1 Tax=Tenacibaculum finnmarkense TaxID=2781243 RepID=UPI0020793AAF|nr:hypothetical protein [Tenacibaculum finnmarkense]MCM8906809.1 hypothetical protein [Tenacibaculum finnmarkense genomovar finnmarkense]